MRGFPPTGKGAGGPGPDAAAAADTLPLPNVPPEDFKIKNGRIKQSVDVPLDKPRRRSDPAFVALKEEILGLLSSVEPARAEV